MLRNRRKLLGLALAALASQAGCYRPSLSRLPERYENVANAIDDVQWFVEAYGYAAISNPLLVKPDATFRFNLTKETADTFFDHARNEINGRSASLYESRSSSGLGLSASVDVAAIQKYLTEQRSYQRDAGVVAEKQRLINQAALIQYEAALQASQSLTDPAKRAEAQAGALTALQNSLAGPAATGTLTYPTTATPPALSTLAAPSASGMLTPLGAPQTLYGAGTPAVSGATRASLVMAAGDTATYAILSLLGDPAKLAQYQDKKVLFGVSMVSVNPGLKTREGFSADLAVRTRYAMRPARKNVRNDFLEQLKAAADADKKLNPSSVIAELHACVLSGSAAGTPADLLEKPQLDPWVFNPQKFDAAPLVAAVSPMADAQTLDLQSAIRRQQELALQIQLALTYAGLNAQAQFFSKFARQQQQDAESRTAMVAANAYSLSGGIFGFQIGPRFTALPGSTRKPAAYMLDRQSFPTLLIFGMDKDDYQPRVLLGKDPENPGNHLCDIVEPHIELTSSTHWLRLEQTHGVQIDDGVASNYRRLKARELYRARQSVERTFDEARSARFIKALSAAIREGLKGPFPRFNLELHGRWLFLVRSAPSVPITKEQKLEVEDVVKSALAQLKTGGRVKVEPCHLVPPPPLVPKPSAKDQPAIEKAQGREPRTKGGLQIMGSFRLGSIPEGAFDTKTAAEPPDLGVCNRPKSDAENDGLWIRIEQPMLDEMARRYELLTARLSGQQTTMPLPEELIVEKAKDDDKDKAVKPTVDQITPEVVELKGNATGQANSQKVQLLIAGKGLDKVDAQNITLVMGQLQGVKPGDKLEAKRVGTSLLLSFEVVSADQPVIFSLPAEKGLVITTKPLVIRMENLVRFEHRTQSKTEDKSERYSFPPGFSEIVLKAEIEKSKPAAPSPTGASSSGPKNPSEPSSK